MMSELLRRVTVGNRHLTFGAIVVLTAIYAFLIANLQLNLTGMIPSPISTTFEWLKSANEKSFERPVTRNTRNLIDLEKTALFKAANSEPLSKGTRSIVDILWYNKPEWQNLTSLNRYIQTKCTYDNCRMSINKTTLNSAAAVIFCLTETLDFMPPVSRNERNFDQAWIFFYHESPVYHFKMKYRHENWRNTMNWSMSYQMDSDIFYPYGYLETRGYVINKNYSKIFHRKSKLAAWAVSHCGARSKRDEFVSELISHGIQIDVFGTCSNGPAVTRTDFNSLINNDYKFYLSFENSLCSDYVTEKFFSYFALDVVLIVRGGLDYEKYLPNGTFINTANFNSAKDLAKYIREVGSSEELYSNFLRNKDKYITRPDSLAFTCSLCEKLNNLDISRKTFEDHVTYVHKDTCWSPTDISFKYNSRLLLIAKLFLFLIVIILGVLLCRKMTLLKLTGGFGNMYTYTRYKFPSNH